MSKSKKISDDMRADLQQKARGLRRVREADTTPKEKAPDNKEQEEVLPKQMEDMKNFQSNPGQQAEEWDSFVANDSGEEERLRQEIAAYASQNNVVVDDLPLENGTIVTHRSMKNGQEVATSYEILEKISAGGFGMTYKVALANHISEKLFVLKEFYPTGSGRNPQDKHINFDMDKRGIREACEEFCKEPKRIHDLIVEHYAPNSEEGWKSLNLVIPKTGAFEDFKNLYYVMDFVEGAPLSHLLGGLADYRSLSLQDRLWIVKKLCKAVKNLQSIGCIHQDITPNNIMVNLKGRRVVLIDYGLCTSMVKQGTKYSLFKYAGTPGFSDVLNFENYNEDRGKLKLLHIFSLGAILAYTCLEKNPKGIDKAFPFKLNSKVECDDINKRPIYSRIDNLVRRSIERELDKRIQTIEDFERELDSIIESNKSVSTELPPLDVDPLDNSQSDKVGEASRANTGPITRNDMSDALLTMPVTGETTQKQEEERVQNRIKEEQEEKGRLRREEEEKRKKEEEIQRQEAETKKAEETAKQRLEEKQEKKISLRQEAEKKRKEEPKQGLRKIVTVLVGSLIALFLVFVVIRDNKQAILSFLGTGTETPVKTPPEQKPVDGNDPDNGPGENWMDNPFADLGKLNHDQILTVLIKAQKDLDFRRQLEQYCHKDLTILLSDQNGLPFKTTLLQLFENHGLEREYTVSEVEISDNKFKTFILTKE